MSALFSWPTVTAGMGLLSAGGDGRRRGAEAPAHVICGVVRASASRSGGPRRARGKITGRCSVQRPGPRQYSLGRPARSAAGSVRAPGRLAGVGVSVQAARRTFRCRLPCRRCAPWLLVRGPMTAHSGIGGPAAGLRAAQRTWRLDRFVAGVRAGEGRALVVRGEPGVGKTVLLDYLAGRASGCRVARAAGVQSEMELAFAGLHQLCAPMLDHAGSLPVPQREALRTAFGLSAGPVPDRFLVGLAVLGLLSGAAGERPLVCVVDDPQWLDRPRRRRWGSRRGGWRPTRWAWCSRRGSRARTWPGCRSSWWRAWPRTMRGRCWSRC